MSQQVVVEYLNPEKLHRNPAFTQVVTVTGPAKTIYVGGQNAVTPSGQIVGKGNLATQAEQVFRNLAAALASAGGHLEHIIKWSIYVVVGQVVEPAFEVFQRTWGRRPNPPAITVMFVSGLANPDFLVEMDAIAVVPPSN